jgi:uncharacterized CHY-type Zn-finger protein
LKNYSDSYNKTTSEVIKEIAKKLLVHDLESLYQSYNFKAKEDLVESGRNIFADTMYFFWIKEVPCLNCNTNVPLFRGYMLAQKRDGKGYHVICPDCGNIFEVNDYRKDAKCPECKREFNLIRTEMLTDNTIYVLSVVKKARL